MANESSVNIRMLDNGSLPKEVALEFNKVFKGDTDGHYSGRCKIEDKKAYFILATQSWGVDFIKNLAKVADDIIMEYSSDFDYNEKVSYYISKKGQWVVLLIHNTHWYDLQHVEQILKEFLKDNNLDHVNRAIRFLEEINKK